MTKYAYDGGGPFGGEVPLVGEVHLEGLHLEEGHLVEILLVTFGHCSELRTSLQFCRLKSVPLGT